MKSYYGLTFVGVALVFGACAAAAVFANLAAEQAKARRARVVAANQLISERLVVLRGQARDLEQSMEPVRQFARAWQQVANVSRANASELIAADLQSIAQRQLGLTADGLLTPPPAKHSFAGTTLDAQRVTLRASGKDLTQLLTWLGAVEKKYPEACIEACEFSPTFGGNTGLIIRLVQPLERRSITAPAVSAAEVSRLLPLISRGAWANYDPSRVKAALPLAIARNPLQPAITPQQQVTGTDARTQSGLSPAVAAALTGHVRSVVRGAIPLVDIDGRILRIGDELVLGGPREKPLRALRIRLKEIGRAALVFHVSGGTAEKPVDGDVPFALPAFFKAR